MCGFVGCLCENPREFSETEKHQFENMNTMIFHRGPDDEGYFRDEHVQFGFRRLSIIDLEAGHQPLTYENDRYVIIFNGEIYNYVELREMLLEKVQRLQRNLIQKLSLHCMHMKEKCVDYLRGMFAFMIWDREEKKLFGARDHLY